MARPTLNSTYLFHEYGLNMQTRTIVIGSSINSSDDEETGITSKTADNFFKNIHILESASKAPITFILDGPGGEVDRGMSIYDCIVNCKCRTIIKGFGMVMSMAAIIFQAANERQLARNARFMIHESEDWASGKRVSNQQAWIEQGKKFNDWQINLFYKKMKRIKPNLDIKEIEDLFLKGDVIYSAQQAIARGLADGFVKSNI